MTKRITHCLFESAATKYSAMPFNRCLYPVDRVVPLRAAGLFGRSYPIAIAIGLYSVFLPYSPILYEIPMNLLGWKVIVKLYKLIIS